ncbi:hypothetical protein, unlikely [Trypanosoma congolense IL3000]|uniref:Uncharacterized protein n=1 Tax=Trypanosoma congolense (strain IL3000) TaxID=1068625 RepID=F9W9I9_TRYCI|nr:hypothetical protein, unlikely [Trypanosoma congolense IL3000]
MGPRCGCFIIPSHLPTHFKPIHTSGRVSAKKKNPTVFHRSFSSDHLRVAFGGSRPSTAMAVCSGHLPVLGTANPQKSNPILPGLSTGEPGLPHHNCNSSDNNDRLACRAATITLINFH